jgi:hypothetical protein
MSLYLVWMIDLGYEPVTWWLQVLEIPEELGTHSTPRNGRYNNQQGIVLICKIYSNDHCTDWFSTRYMILNTIDKLCL